MNKTTIYFSESTQRRLRDLARRRERSQADLIREAVDRYLDEAPMAGLPPSVGIVEDGGLDAADIEDWLRANWQAR